jgi:acyl carrier protein
MTEHDVLTDEDRRHLEELRELVADVLEVEPAELTDEGDFQNEYDADSLRAIEMLARIEKKYKISIPQKELASMQNLRAVYSITATYAKAQDQA